MARPGAGVAPRSAAFPLTVPPRACTNGAVPTLSRLRAVVAVALLAAPALFAHAISRSYGEWRVRGAQVHGRLRLATAEAQSVLLLDRDGDGRVTADELRAASPAIVRALLGEVKVRAGGAPCLLDAGGSAGPDEADGIALEATWTCAEPVRALSVRMGFIELLPPGHVHLARIVFEGQAGAPLFERVAQQGRETIEVEGGGAAEHATFRIFLLGIEHIFTGYDHIAFLLGLLLLGGSLGSMVRIVSSFTLAHSITLALAALDVFAPPPAVIEPSIAASIIFVAGENLWALRGRDRTAPARALAHRWAITFLFGLVHGFGFASALRELHLPRERLALALLGFNAGVEVGQVCIVALALPLLAWLRARTRFSPRGEQALSLGIGALGLFWLVGRLVSG